MLAIRDPHEAYRRSSIDLRIAGAAKEDLVVFCFEELVASLGAAVLAHRRADAPGRSKGLTRALTALTALEMGVDRDAPLGSSLLQLYGAGRQAILDSVQTFDPDKLLVLREDFEDIRQALTAS